MGNPDSGEEYIEWRFKGLSADEFARGIELMGEKKRGRVKELYLGCNSLKEVPRNLFLFASLNDLDLGSNLLKSVPTFFGGMVSLKRIFLEKNVLSSLPDEMEYLVSLEELFCDDNEFTEIPKPLWKLTKLTKLYFRNNKLSSIPADTPCKLKRLRSFGLSGNKALPNRFQFDVVDNHPQCQKFLQTFSSGDQTHTAATADFEDLMKRFCELRRSRSDFEALQVLKQAVDLDKSSGYAKWEYGCALHSGDFGLTKDVAKGVALYKQAAELGFAPAMSDLALCLNKGVGTKTDVDASLFWVGRALQSKHDYSAGILHFYGVGVPKDHAISVLHFTKAAPMFPEACFYLNMLSSVISDKMNWLSLGAREGNPRCIESLESSKTCFSCGGTFSNLKRCGACKLANYCTPDCQQKDWKKHKMFCIQKI